ncbi:MAG: NAD(P)H-dependent glycerol-3-phosphate dehydrogenase [Armatimonadetes bacterium]|nr:NAD(P)H-dependent glycerol-3-phosphate dehydrogenase [Armatimonadota bacterium]NIM23116.1 NAD(P)H-dependent glycerol-3-phosphate dehydrogenase [Armatimonadota bacterium]NIM66984.1 NAD(P)H-dependent glycerol-3-phosphate dehydrogenase [Armatimonadota bacterium]NIM75518.1 NAD(P)H-dependent glycerol-3-phosphate dehydrogenase [Armatimonadota bacterium]NIN05173.1 NAD(P)H-dependent glycerol-3-phosphate dehydrogenase [Armatimonadota bacterium]
MKNTDSAPTISILGAGSWGTALAVLLGRQGRRVRLWPRRREQVGALSKNRENALYLPGAPLPEEVEVCGEIGEAVSGAGLTVFAVPAKGMKAIANQAALHLDPTQPVLSVAKGLEPDSGQRMSEVLSGVLPQQPLAVLSGPNLAVEVAAGIPTTSVAASREEGLSRLVQKTFMCPTFRVYTNSDVIGVELGGALKNIIAIGAGISDGLGFGDNTKAALMTRGLAEMTRLGVAMGAEAPTFQGLSGLGDLMATCASPRSRNYKVGSRLGRGERLSAILQSMDQIAEGVPTTKAAVALAARHQVEMPIAAHLHRVLFEDTPPQQAVAELMNRPARDEREGYE